MIAIQVCVVFARVAHIFLIIRPLPCSTLFPYTTLFRSDLLEDLHAHALGADEAVAELGIGLEGPPHAPAGRLDGAGDDLLELDLVRPGRHVRALAQVTAGDEVDGPLGRGSALARRGQGVDALGGGGHGAVPSWFMDACSARGDVVG